MKLRLPSLAIALGLVGLVPFIVCGIAALKTQQEAVAVRWLLALIGYGAVVLAFWGGAQWGSLLATAYPPADGSNIRERFRLALTVAPPLIGWVALLVVALPLYEVALAVLIIGYIATLVAEMRWRRLGLLPAASMWLRWGLTVVVVVVLVTTLALRLLGAKIIF
jgi:hypothetical protein